MSDTRTKKDKLLTCLRRGEAGKVAALLDGFPEEVEPDMAADTANNRLLHRAARFGHPGVITRLLERGADPNINNKFGMTPLHHGAVQGGAEVLQALLDGGADPNAADQAGRLPLHWTATKGHVGGARVLLEGGAEGTLGDRDGFTPLHRCAQEEPPPVKKTKDGEVVAEEEVVDKAAVDGAKAEIAKMLLQRGADVGDRDMKGLQTPLHLAAMNGLVEVAGVLVEAGADLDCVNKIGQTALIYAVVEEQVDMVRLLIGKGANVNKGNNLHWGWTPLHWAALTDNVAVVEAVLDGEGVKNVKDMTDRYPATLAEEHDKRTVLEMLRKLDKE